MTRQPRLLTMIALVTALFLRVWVPAGWMPAATGGAFAIQPCAAAAPVPMEMHGKAHHKSSHKAQHEGDCAFSPLHSGATPNSSAPALVAVPLAAASLPHHAPAPFFATGPPAPPPPATGPPTLA
jgi:hypothetical protein